MLNKGIVRFFSIALGLISIYQISKTFVAKKVESDAKIYADGDVKKERQYLDSISKDKVFGIYDYKDAKNNQLNLGLDLKGGINVILQVSVRDVLTTLSQKSQNPVFLNALDAASKQQSNSQDDYLTLFLQEFDRINQENGGSVSLSDSDVFGNNLLSEKIGETPTDEKIKSVLEKEVEDAVSSSYDVISSRIDRFGVTSPTINRIANTGRISVELAGVKNIDRVKRLLQETAYLEFWKVYGEDATSKQQFYSFFSSVDEKLKQINNANKTKTEEKDLTLQQELTEETDSLFANIEEKTDDDLADTRGPLLKLVQGAPQSGPVLFLVNTSDVEEFSRYMKLPTFRQSLPPNLRYVKLLWGKPDRKSSEITPLYAIEANRKNDAPIKGEMITSANQDYDPTNGAPIVTMDMNSSGARKWANLTKEMQGRFVAAVLDSIVYSAPSVNTVITGGSTVISGGFNVTEAQDLATKLNAGKLPARADILQAEIVGPSLGKEAIDSGLKSFIAALIIVLLWMIFYYAGAGIYADLALLINILFIFGALSSLGASLTLPGIAGIVLTIGMSVDANVIIYERIKEELAKGKTIKEAVKDGFSFAFSSILDANVTTLITGVILIIFGSGPIKGFATTLIIGIFTSFITAIFLTRLFIEKRIENKSLSFYQKSTKNWFTNINIDFIGKRKVSYVVSIILIVISLAALFTKGLNLGVDFVGGRTYKVRFEEPVNTQEIAQKLGAVFLNEEGKSVIPEVKTVGEDNQVKITTKYKVNQEGTDVDDEITNLLYSGLKDYLSPTLSYKDFNEPKEDATVGILSSLKVGPSIADNITKGAFYSVLFSLFVVFLYILLRFRKYQFSVGAVVAVFHDVIIVLGIFSIFYGLLPFSLEINQAFIAAILTVIGYSLNDTVIVFDRVREFIQEKTSINFKQLTNSALSSTLSRTVNTSLTTLFVLLMIFIFGGDTIKGFMFGLIVGVLVGTYSSLFIASPVMYDLSKKERVSEKEV